MQGKLLLRPYQRRNIRCSHSGAMQYGHPEHFDRYCTERAAQYVSRSLIITCRDPQHTSRTSLEMASLLSHP